MAALSVGSSSGIPDGGTKLFRDLRAENGTELRYDAPAIIQAVLFYPCDRKKQDRLIAFAHRDAEDLSTSAIQQRRIDEISLASRAALAGRMLLNLIGLDVAGIKPSLSKASALLSDQWEDDELRSIRGLNTGRQKKRHLDAWHEFQPAAHLWATVLLSHAIDPATGRSYAPDFLQINKTEDLIEFLHIADWLSVRASQIILIDANQKQKHGAMVRRHTWRFILPRQHAAPRDWIPIFPYLTEHELSRI